LNTVADPNADSITILTGGVYEISATIFALQSSGGTVNYNIRRNDLDIPGSQFGLATTNSSVTVGKTIEVALIAGDELTVVPDSVSNPNLQYASAALTVELIGL
jgi:hypothetical protein